MKITMITHQFTDISFGGVENHILFLSEELVRLGHDVTVIRLGGGSSDNNYLFDFKVIDMGRQSAQVLGKSGRSNIVQEFYFRLLANTFSKKQFAKLTTLIADSDIIHFHDFLSISRLSKKVKRSGKRVVWTNHLGEFLKIQNIPLGYRVTKFLSSGFDVAIAPSLELCNQRAITPSVHYIPNAVNIQVFAQVGAEIRNNLKLLYQIPRNKIIFLVPRRWAPTKGVLDLVRELRFERNEDCFFLFVGSGSSAYEDYRAEIKSELNNWKIDFKIVESASIFEMSDYYKLSDFTFIPSREEATSLAALEAMACGSIVLATPVGGLVQIITNGVNGLLAKPRDSNSLLDLFREAVNLDKTIKRQITSNALGLVTDNYTWTKITFDTLSIYRDTVSSKN